MYYYGRQIVIRTIQKTTNDYPAYMLGKKSLQKILYLFNLHADQFHFQWGDSGPYSGEIRQIMHDLESCGHITITPVPSGKPNEILYTIKHAGEPLPTKISPEAEKELDKAIKFAVSINPKELMFLASVHFLGMRNNANFIRDTLNDTDAENRFMAHDITIAQKKLKENGFIV